MSEAIEYADVANSLTASTTTISSPFTIRFRVLGGSPGGFTFPFSNESLTEPLLQFIKEDEHAEN